ncbi:hypothetical protein K438DRAFT_1933409 [Mycena galopus ATCC 62051]|nr:hypothetical protein K438DRAFT_1933409 [Mycena galopus ATCC 62051]
MSFVPRRPPARSPPPAYQMPPSYGDLEPPAPPAQRSSSSSPPRLRSLSVSPTMSEREFRTFGHPIAPLRYSFDPYLDPPSPPLSLPPVLGDHSRAFSFQTPSAPADSSLFYDPTGTNQDSYQDAPLPVETPFITTSPQLSIFPAAPRPKPQRAKRALPSARAPSPDADISDAKDFEIVVWTCPTPKKPSSTARKPKKAAKVEPSSHGPITANTDMAWEDTLDAVAILLGTTSEFLVISSIEWRWLKPQNSAWLPLRNLGGYSSLIKQILSPPKAVSMAYIIVKMDEPMRAPPKVPMPWVSQPVAGPSSGPGSFESTYKAVMGFEDPVSDDDGGNGKVKVSFDDGLEEEMDKISNAYPPGTCSLHPAIECFHHRVADLHFALDRPKKIVWAAAMKKGTASIISPPLGSNHFKAKAAIKTTAVPNVAVPTLTNLPPPSTPAAPAAQPTNPYSNPYPYPPIPPIPFPPPMGYPPYPSYHPTGFYGHAPHLMPWQETPRAHRRGRSWDGSSPPEQSTSKRRRQDRRPDPPSSPALSGGSVDEFLAQYADLPDGTGRFLRELGFEIGDDLSVVTEAQWKAGGLTLFGWNRVTRAYNKYKNSLRN